MRLGERDHVALAVVALAIAILAPTLERWTGQYHLWIALILLGVAVLILNLERWSGQFWTRRALRTQKAAKKRLARVEKNIQWIEEMTDRELLVRISGVLLLDFALIGFAISYSVAQANDASRQKVIFAFGLVMYIMSLLALKSFVRFSKSGLDRLKQQAEKLREKVHHPPERLEWDADRDALQ